MLIEPSSTSSMQAGTTKKSMPLRVSVLKKFPMPGFEPLPLVDGLDVKTLR